MFRGSSHCSTSSPSHRRIFTIRPHRTSHRGNLHQGFGNTSLEVHNSSLQHNHLYTRDKAQSQNNNHLIQEGYGTKPNNNHLFTKRDKAQTQIKEEITNLVITIDHKQLLVITIDHKQYFSQKQDPIDRIEMIAQE